MNHRPTDTDDWQRPPGRSLRTPMARSVRGLAAGLALAVCVIAQSPSDRTGLQRLVAKDAATLLDSEHPEIRGEAALIVAASGERQHESKLLELAKDEHPLARQRATIALGLLGTDACVRHLEQQLLTIDGRIGDDAIAAAFGLGLLPLDAVGTSIARTLPLFERGSWKRQHDTLVALLMAMSTQPERPERHALRALFDDDANRAEDVRARLLGMLLSLDQMERRTLGRLLRRGTDDERVAIMQWLANQSPKELQPWRDELVRIAERDEHPVMRAGALRALTQLRHLPALEIAARALRSSSAVECGQGMQSMLAIGGARTRGALEQHLLNERDANRKAAMLRGFKAPPSTQLANHAAEIAVDNKLPFDTRVAAAELLARGKPQRAAPILRDLFREATDESTLQLLAEALQRVESTPTALKRLLNLPVELTQHPQRWRALLLAQHAEAQRQVLATLQNSKASERDVLTALRAWRGAMVFDARDESGTPVPARLAELLR